MEVRLAKILPFTSPRLPFQRLAARIQPPEGLLREDWANHPNGGGWVQKTAFAAETAYIGPRAIISGNARVLDFARVLDEASITDRAMIWGDAVIAGTAHVGGNAKIFGTACIAGSARVGGDYFLQCGGPQAGISLVVEACHPRREAKKGAQMQLYA